MTKLLVGFEFVKRKMTLYEPHLTMSVFNIE